MLPVIAGNLGLLDLLHLQSYNLNSDASHVASLDLIKLFHRCFNQKNPMHRDLLMTAISNGARIPQQIQLYHNRETSRFDYS